MFETIITMFNGNPLEKENNDEFYSKTVYNKNRKFEIGQLDNKEETIK